MTPVTFIAAAFYATIDDMDHAVAGRDWRAYAVAKAQLVALVAELERHAETKEKRAAND